MNLLTELLLNPPTVASQPALEAKQKRAPVTSTPDIYRPVMLGKGPMTVRDIMQALPGKSRCAIGVCLRNTLEPLGYVRVGYAMNGKQKILNYEWVAE